MLPKDNFLWNKSFWINPLQAQATYKALTEVLDSLVREGGGV